MSHVIESFSGTRGVFDPALIDLAKRHAKAYADFLKKKAKRPKIVIGRDSRPHGTAIEECMCRVLAAEGVQIILAGILPTPAIELAVQRKGLDGGIIITASHNPPEHNGWKLLRPTGAILTPQESSWVIDHAKQAKCRESELHAEDAHNDLLNTYVRYVAEKVGKIGKVPLVCFDPNGGAGATVITPIAKALGIRAAIINGKLGSYAHEIEPTGKTLAANIPFRKKKRLPLAFGFDCDADRVEIILADGTLINGNHILAIIVDHILRSQKGTVVTNDATSLLVSEIAARHQCPIVEVEVGETNVVEKMNDLQSPVGGEGSNGGVIISPGQCRDGILTAFLLLKIMGDRQKTLKEIIRGYPSYFQKGQKVTCDPKDVIAINKALEKSLKVEGYRVERHGDAMGTVKAYTDEGFIFFRASRTEPGKVRIITDAKTEERAEGLLATALRHFSSVRKQKIYKA